MIFATFADFSGPLISFFSFSVLNFVTFVILSIFAIVVLGVFSQQEKSLLLLRFLRHLRTFRCPSWPFLFLSLESCYICYSCDFCDICERFSYIIFSQLFLLLQLRKKFASKFLITRSILHISSIVCKAIGHNTGPHKGIKIRTDGKGRIRK